MDVGVRLDHSDNILAAIAASLGGGAVVGVVTVGRFHTGLTAGTLGATVFIWHAIFANPPRPAPSPKANVAAVVWHVVLRVLLIPTTL